MNRPFLPFRRGFALSEVIVFLAIVAFLAAIIVPGALHRRSHRAVEKLGAEASETTNDQWAMRDGTGDDGVVFLKAAPR
jgi:type II secretory pathway pseudopilin PulG